MEDNKAFRDYATRVSFSLNMSRNQVSVLRSMVLDIETVEMWRRSKQPYLIGKLPGRDDRRAQLNPGSPDAFVVGARWLCSAGLIKWTDPTTMTPKWSREPWELTEAGHHVVALLRIAGLIPMPAVNTNTKPAKKRRRIA